MPARVPRQRLNSPPPSKVEKASDSISSASSNDRVPVACSRRSRIAAATGVAATGVAAAVVQTPEDLDTHDEQLRQSGVFFDLDHPVLGVSPFEGGPTRFGRTRQDFWRSAPLLGEDDRDVFRELLGLGEDEYCHLVDEGAI